MLFIYTFTMGWGGGVSILEKVKHFWKHAHSLSCQPLDEEIPVSRKQVIIWHPVPVEVKEVRSDPEEIPPRLLS